MKVGINITELIVSIVFSFTGLLFMIGGIWLSVAEFDKKDRFVQHTAIISNIERYIDSDGYTAHRAYVDYTVSGVQYDDVPLNYYSSGMYIGKEAIIYYDPDNPRNIIAGGGAEYLFLIFPAIGAMFFIIGASIGIVKFKKANGKKRLMEYGELIYADIEQIGLNSSYSVNGRSPYLIYCHWTDPDSLTTYTFKSPNIWGNPEPQMKAKGLTNIPVYIDRGNPKKYYVSVDELLG